MTLQDLITLSINGELKNTAVSGDTDTVIGYTNLGMIEIYKRFPIETKEYLLELQEGVDIYTMPSDFMWIVTAYDEVPEASDKPYIQIPVNEEDNPMSINTVGWNKIQIPVITGGAFVSIIYTSAPAMYTSANLGDDLVIPPQMVEPLLQFIAYKAHTSIDGNAQAENNVHYQRFEYSCKLLEDRGMITSDDLDTSNRLFNRGFV